jgi:hypothetical protein
VHWHECNTHNFYLIQKIKQGFSYTIFPVKKNKFWKSFKIMIKLLFNYFLYSHLEIGNFRVWHASTTQKPETLTSGRPTSHPRCPRPPPAASGEDAAGRSRPPSTSPPADPDQPSLSRQRRKRERGGRRDGREGDRAALVSRTNLKQWKVARLPTFRKLYRICLAIRGYGGPAPHTVNMRTFWAPGCNLGPRKYLILTQLLLSGAN